MAGSGEADNRYVDLEIFGPVARVFADAIRRGSGIMRTDWTGRPRIVVWDHEYFERRRQEAKLSAADFVAARMDMVDVLQAFAANYDLAAFKRVRTNPRPSWAGPEGAETTTKKYRLVAKLFDVDFLRRSTQIKTAAKSNLYLAAEWEVLTKHADSEKASADDPLPFGVLSVYTANGALRDPPFEVKSIVFDAADLEALLQTLKRLRAKLREHSV